MSVLATSSLISVLATSPIIVTIMFLQFVASFASADVEHGESMVHNGPVARRGHRCGSLPLSLAAATDCGEFVAVARRGQKGLWSATQTHQHDNTTQPHNNTTTHQHNNASTQHHNNTTSQHHNTTTTQTHNNTTSHHHNNTTPQHHTTTTPHHHTTPPQHDP